MCSVQPHSIKGGSAIFGFTAMTGLTHVMENMLDRARNEELSLTNELITVLLETVDVLKDILHSYRNDEEIDWDVVETNKAILEKELDLAMSGQAVNDQAELDSDVQQAESGSEEASEADEGFGFFDQSDDSDDDDGFGFFDEDISVSASSHSDEDDQGFGFFDETLDSSSDESNDGFGFFDDAPAAPTKEKKVDDDEIEGFGFFESESDDVNDGDVASKDSDSSAAKNPSDAGAKDDGFGFFDESMKARHEQDKIDDKQGYGLYPKEKKEPSSKVATAPRTTKTKPATKPAETKSSEATSIRVETVKIDKLVNLVGELVITQSMLNLIGNEVQESVAEKMMGALAELERNTREIQEAVMSVRMLPISFVFNRFPRLVRDLSVKMEKQIELVIEGASTEIDKNLVEKISDPLTHLIRNSVDHGIEKPEVRKAAGKLEKGTVRLSALQKGGEIVISILDDGAGLNRERIVAKAEEKRHRASRSTN